MTLTDHDPAALGAAVIDYVRRVLVVIDEYEARKTAAVADLEGRGYRIVGGGQTGEGHWELFDWRTHELVASGVGGHEECDSETDRLDPDRRWIHIDSVTNDVPYDTALVEAPPALPRSLVKSLLVWVENNEDDARAL